MYFFLIKDSKFSNFYIINMTTFYLVNILNNSCRLSKINQQSLNLGLKLPHLSIFRLIFRKNNSYLKQPYIFQNAKFHAKLKILKFGTKNGFIWVFLDWNFKKPLSYLKSTPSNLSSCKVLSKNKNS